MKDSESNHALAAIAFCGRPSDAAELEAVLRLRDAGLVRHIGFLGRGSWELTDAGRVKMDAIETEGEA